MTGLRQSPLHEQHQARRAAFTALFGWSLPGHFGDPAAEYRAARGRVAVVDLSFLTMVRAEGADSAGYLNRRLSQLVLNMHDGDGCRAALLGATGKMEADIEVYAREDSHLLLAPPFEGDQLAPRLERFVFSEDCRFHDETLGHAKFALIGPGFADLLKALGVEPLDASVRSAPRTMAGQRGLRLMHSDYVPEGLLLTAPAPTAGNIWDELLLAAGRIGGRAAGWTAFNARRIEAGVPWFGIDIDHETIPLEARLTQALHYNKGCYPGQETIAKITHLGHPARRLVPVRLDGPGIPELPVELLAGGGAPAGRLTSAAWSPARKHIGGMATVKWALQAAGTELRLKDSKRRATVQETAGE